MNIGDGFLIQKWIKCQEKAENHDLILEIRGDKFVLKGQLHLGLGSFNSINELYAFLCGYEQPKECKNCGYIIN